MRRLIAALLPSAVVAISVGSMVASLGIVSGLSYASRLLLGTRRSVNQRIPSRQGRLVDVSLEGFTEARSNPAEILLARGWIVDEQPGSVALEQKTAPRLSQPVR
jgi:hypothetical protein